MFRRIRILLILFSHSELLRKAYVAVNDPASKEGRRVVEDLTLEEMGGITDLEVVYRIFNLSPKELKTELGAIERSLKTNK